MTSIGDYLIESHILKVIENFESIMRMEDGEVTDPFWRNTRDLYRSLTPQQQVHLLKCHRQSAVDAVSSLLLVVDDFMCSNPAGQSLAGALTRDGLQNVGSWQEDFLAQCEERLYGK